MMYLKWALMAPLSLLLNIGTMILAPLLALLSMVTGPTLPGPLSLFHTHDDDLDGGQHQLGWPPAHGVKLWWQRTHWIWRNPAYGFDAWWFGYPGPITPISIQFSPEGDVKAVFLDAKGRRLFTRRTSTYWSNRHYVKLFIGWSYWDNGTGRHMIKVDFNPFKSRGPL